MDIRNVNKVERSPVRMDGAERASMAVLVGREHGAPNFAMRVIHVEAGGHTPRHSHDYEHEVLVLGGSGTVLLHGDEHPLSKGDVLLVPSDELHQFRASEGEPLEFICLVPASRNCGEPTPGS